MGEPRQADQRLRERAQVGGGSPANAVEEPPDREAVDHPQGPRLVERRERQPAILQHLDEHPTRRREHERPELGIAHDAERDLDAPRRHPRDDDLRAEVSLEVLVRLLERGRVVDPEPHAPDVGLVLHARGRGLHRDGEPQSLGGRDRVLERVGVPARDDRHAVVREQREPLELVERLAARQARAPALARLLGRRRVAPDDGQRPVVTVVEQVPERGEPGERALERGRADLVQSAHVVPVDAGGEVAEHRHRLVGLGPHVQEAGEVALLVGIVRHEVDGERERRDVRVLHQRAERAGDDLARLAPGPPEIERVDRQEALIEELRELPGRLRPERRERHTGRRGGVDHHRALPARVVPGRQRAGPGPSPGDEQRERVGHLVERLDAVHAVALEQGLVRAVLAGERPRVGGDHLPRERLTPDLQRDDRHVALVRHAHRGAEALGIADRLDEQADRLRARQAERVPHVVRGRRDVLLAGGHDEVEAQVAVVVHEGREGRARVADEGDASGRELGGLLPTGRPQAPLHVHEPHAVAAADRHPGSTRDLGEALDQRRCILARLLEPTRVDQRRARSGLRARRERVLEQRVRERDHREVDRLGHLGDRCVAPVPEQLVVPGVDRVHGAVEPAELHELPQRLVADRALAPARADDGDRTRLEHALERRPACFGAHLR